MPRKNWFIDLETKAQMNTNAIVIIEEIMGEIHTTAEEKVVGIAQALQGLNQAWNMKKDSSPQGAPRETIQPQCNIDVSKVESLVEFPLIERGRACKNCLCFKCGDLYRCHRLKPSTIYHCKVDCDGTLATTNCGYRSKS